MQKGADVLERSCLQAGKIFIKEGEENARAYMVQVGEVLAFTMDGDRKIEIERLGPGSIVGERHLAMDEPATISYEAIVPTTVIVITRQEFQKILSKVDKSIKTVLDHALEKIKYYERLSMSKAVKNSQIDDTAHLLVQNLLADVPDSRKRQYEDAILPHVNGMIMAIKNIKKSAKKN